MTDYISFLLAESELDFSAEDASAEAEMKIISMLKGVCAKMQIDLIETAHPVHYDHGSREAEITFYEAVSLQQIQAFADIADNIRVRASASYRDAAVIEMEIKPGLETATIS
jgi:hypothetical protein